MAFSLSFASCKQARISPAEEAGKKEGLHILAHSGSLPASIVDIFSQETGIPVAVQVCDSDVQMQQLFAQSTEIYDVLELGESLAAKLVQEKKLAPLTKEAIPNIQNLDACFLGLSFDPSNRYTLPYLSGVVGILYNSEHVKGEVQGYEDIFNPQYAARIAVPNDNREIVACALAQLNINFDDLALSNLEDVRKQLTKWVPLIGKFNPRIPVPTLLRRGDAVAAIARSGDATVLMKEDSKFKWVVPSVGAHSFVESLAISATAPHPREAEQFINFLLRPDISSKISHQYPYFNPNRVARELLPKEDQKCLCLLPPNKDSHQLFPSLDSGMFQGLSKFVETLRSK